MASGEDSPEKFDANVSHIPIEDTSAHVIKTGASFFQDKDREATVGDYLDFAENADKLFKVDEILGGLHDHYFYCGLAEIFLFFFQTFFLLSRNYANGLGFCVFSLLHPVRAALGFYIKRKLPMMDELN